MSSSSRAFVERKNDDKANFPAVFIDGEVGTVGLSIRERLAASSSIRVLSIKPELRKNLEARLDIIAQADAVVLCLPDIAAREIAPLIDALGENGPKVLDASTAHRVQPGWVYGFPELLEDQFEAIRASRRVTNPGCYPTGALALLRPLVDAGAIPPDYPITINAVSGYSGGGTALIKDFETGSAPAFQIYGLDFEHKHLPELQFYSGLKRSPIFVPSVGNFRQGMLLCIPLHLDTLPSKIRIADVHDILTKRYIDSEYISVSFLDSNRNYLEAEVLNGTNKLQLFLCSDEAQGHTILIARFDNLGKGAGGAAVQNLRIMLGVPE